jgi:hypothetical protein
LSKRTLTIAIGQLALVAIYFVVSPAIAYEDRVTFVVIFYSIVGALAAIDSLGEFKITLGITVAIWVIVGICKYFIIKSSGLLSHIHGGALIIGIEYLFVLLVILSSGAFCRAIYLMVLKLTKQNS